MVGLGRMGANLVQRLVSDGHHCVVYDANAATVAQLQGPGIVGASSLADVIDKTSRPRTLWLMLPAAVTEEVINELQGLLEPDDVIIDGGNSFYRDDVLRANQLSTHQIHHVDCGTSGGIWGRERGYSLMIGGDTDVVKGLEPIFVSIAPGPDGTTATPGRQRDGDTAAQGYLHCGDHGAGHFVKMVHNGVEYGMMASIAEGLNVLKNANVGKLTGGVDAETAPLREPEYFLYDFNVADIAELWRHGSVVSSWLMDLTSIALAVSPELDAFSGRVSDSGEGRWTVEAAIEESVPVPVISAALWQRYESRQRGLFAARVMSAMRSQFGGHQEKAN